MKFVLPALLACLFAVGCTETTRYSCVELGCKDVARCPEKPRRDYEAEASCVLEKYPHWGANRIVDGKLVRPKNIYDTHPRPLVDDTFFFHRDCGLFGQHPSAGDPGRHYYVFDCCYPYGRRLFFHPGWFPWRHSFWNPWWGRSWWGC